MDLMGTPCPNIGAPPPPPSTGVTLPNFLFLEKFFKRFSREPLQFSGQKLENKFHELDEWQITLEKCRDF